MIKIGDLYDPKALPDAAGSWWNKDTESWHDFADWRDDGVFCERVKWGSAFNATGAVYKIYDPSASCPWFGPFLLPKYPRGV